MAQFIILLEENDNAWAKLSPEERQEIMQRYIAWVRELRSKDLMKAGEPLGRGGRALRVVDGQLVDGPYTETKEVLTGFFIIEAPDLDAATEIAKACPALAHGERVLVRPINDDPEHG